MQIIAFLYVLEMVVEALQNIRVNQYFEVREEHAVLCLPFSASMPW